MSFLKTFTAFAAPLFLILSPILSYSDQAFSMHRKRTSAGFSLDIPLIMLVASFFRVFYYPGARFDMALLLQSFVMIIIQLILLKIALDNRPSPSSKGGEAALPFVGAQEPLSNYQRPYHFWQWRASKPYWQFLVYLFLGLAALELTLSPFHSIYPVYSELIGYIGLSVEATLPLPQLATNAKTRSCKGFRFSVLLSWLIGDALKMYWFFTATTEIPLAFKLCGMFQAGCDVLLGVQFFLYGEGSSVSKQVRDMWPYSAKGSLDGGAISTGRGSPLPLSEKSF